MPIQYKDKLYETKWMSLRLSKTSENYENTVHDYLIAPESLLDALCEGSDDGTIITDDDGTAEDIDAMIYHYVPDDVFFSLSDKEIALNYLDEPYDVVTEDDYEVLSNDDIISIAMSLSIETTSDMIDYVKSNYASSQKDDPTGDWTLVVEDLLYQYKTLNHETINHNR